MNSSENDLSPPDREMLDRLVDGELPDAQRRELLARLDRVPGGWRTCALGFLEAQCMEAALGELSETLTRRPETVAPPAAVSEPRGLWPRRIQTALAMAASFLVALGIGWWAGGLRPAMDGLTRGPVEGLVADAGRGGGTPPLRSAAPASPAETPGRSPTMVVALPSGVAGQEVRVPVVEGDEHDRLLMFPDAAGIPASFRDALQRAGYQVRQSRDLLPFPVEGGRQAIVPVDQVDVHYVGNHVE
jgi:hypothetical protein